MSKHRINKYGKLQKPRTSLLKVFLSVFLSMSILANPNFDCFENGYSYLKQ